MLNEDDFRDMMPDSREVYEQDERVTIDLDRKPVVAKLVKVLEDSPKGISQAELKKAVGTFEIPQGPARIGSQWW
tara:strand:- start:453 stop:677 length:225 start_codon:yes stop_codon:yes gene_type:complete